MATATLIARKLCQHCRYRVVSRARGLCDPCYKRPEIRESRPISSKYAQTGYGHKPAKRWPQPTQYLPGTPEKIEVLEQRAKNGEYLWHPADAVACGR